MADRNNHWTETSYEDFRFRIASDFIAQLESRLEELKWSQAHLAERLGVTEGRVSQLLNNPGNLSLNVMVKCARAMEMKLAVMAYDDGDKDNLRGPVNAEVFRACWEKCGAPSDLWELNQSTANSISLNDIYRQVEVVNWLPRGSIILDPHVQYYADAANIGLSGDWEKWIKSGRYENVRENAA